MRLFKKVAIVGTGLIGGSIALAIKKHKLADKVVGVSRHKKSILAAMKIKSIDEGSLSLKIVEGADLLIFATPVNTIIKLGPKIFKTISRDCIVTDVGSTKEEIVKKLEKLFPNYLGSHPLAGSERRSILNAHADLFFKTVCILTPTKITSPKVLAKIKKLWFLFGARTVELNPKEHDRILAFVSHLPHIGAFSLMNSVKGTDLRFAASGLKDSTRIAASDSELWADIFLSNRENIIRAINSLQKNISLIRKMISSGNRQGLILSLKKAKAKREKLS